MGGILLGFWVLACFSDLSLIEKIPFPYGDRYLTHNPDLSTNLRPKASKRTLLLLSMAGKQQMPSPRRP